MKTITLTVDETQQAQVVWSSDLAVYFRLYTIQQSDVQADINAASAQLQSAQAQLQTLSSLIAQTQVTPPQVP